MTEIVTEREWATDLFGSCDFGDKRLTKRMIQIATQLVSQIGRSLSASCQGSSAQLEGSYRFIRNPKVTATAIAEGGFQATVNRCNDSTGPLLAIEDTTTLGYTHAAIDELGDLGGPSNTTAAGFIVHSILMSDADSGYPLGLIEQNRWKRNAQERGKRQTRADRSYKNKESYKWEYATQRMESRLPETTMRRVISVSDRESDIYEYMHYKLANAQRFVIRASHNRKLETLTNIANAVKESLVLGHYECSIGQKAGRLSRKARIELRSCAVELSVPKEKDAVALDTLEVNVVCAREIGEDSSKLNWILLTTEPVDSYEDCLKVVGYYEKRWLIEEFHKAWKTGAGAERQRMQSADNLEKMVTTLSFVAVRLLQLKWIFETQEKQVSDRTVDCTAILDKDEWQVLWKTMEKTRCPSSPPSISWAYKAIAKLGGWSDSKRTGRASWSTIWAGWFRLTERLEGYLLAKELAKI